MVFNFLMVLTADSGPLQNKLKREASPSAIEEQLTLGVYPDSPIPYRFLALAIPKPNDLKTIIILYLLQYMLYFLH